MRLLYARAGTPRCPDHHIDLAAQTVSQMVDAVLAHPEGTALMLLAPAIAQRKGEHAELIEELQAGGFVRARIDGKVVELDQAPKLDVRRKHTVEAIVDRFKVRPDLAQRLAESFETALRLGAGVARIAYMDEPSAPSWCFPDKFACPICNYSLSELEPRLFSFNSPIGACPTCDGLGTQEFFDPGQDRRQSASVLGGRRGARLGSAQRLLFSADSIARAATRSSTSKRRSRACRKKFKIWCCSAAAMSRSNSSTWTARAAPCRGGTPLKASCKQSRTAL